MDGTDRLKKTTRVTAPVGSSKLSPNVFTAPGKTMVGERPKPFGEPLGFDPITSTLIFGEYDAVLVDAMGTVAEAEALADWVALHNRNLETIYITHAHFDHFYGLSILLDRFPGARAIATPKTVKAMQMSFTPAVERLARRMFPGQVATKLVPPEPYEPDTFTLEGRSIKRRERSSTIFVASMPLYANTIPKYGFRKSPPPVSPGPSSSLRKGRISSVSAGRLSSPLTDATFAQARSSSADVRFDFTSMEP
jgi:hypothetical protein